MKIQTQKLFVLRVRTILISKICHKWFLILDKYIECHDSHSYVHILMKYKYTIGNGWKNGHNNMRIKCSILGRNVS